MCSTALLHLGGAWFPDALRQAYIRCVVGERGLLLHKETDHVTAQT